MKMWNNLERWQKSIVILVVFFVVLYTLGRVLVPIDAVDHPENYKWPPLMYSIFMALPILLLKYSQRKFVRTTASVILVVFLLIVLVPVLLKWPELYGNALNSCGNTFVAIFSLLYVAPLIGGLIVLIIFGGGM